MIKLRKELQTILTQTLGNTAGVYYAKTKLSHPNTYVIFTCEVISHEDFRKNIELEINCIDNSFDSTLCETIADNIVTALDHNEFITNDIGFYCYLNKRNSMAEQDEKIVRRRLVFDLYLYERT